MASQTVELKLRVNTETGELEILSQQFEKAAGGAKKVSEATSKTSSSFSGLSKEAKDLASSLLPFATAAGIIQFFSSAVKGAEEQNEAFRRLRGAIEANGGAWEKSEKQVNDWVNSIAASTRFSDGEAIDALDRLTRTTGNVTQAQKASQLAMDISTSTGKSLSDSVRLVTDLVNGNQRALMEARREMGSFVGNAQDTQQALDNLSSKVSGASQNATGFTTEVKKLENAFSQFKDVVGNAIIPVFVPIINFATDGIQKFEQFGLVVGSVAAKLATIMTANVGAEMKTKLQSINDETEAQFIELERKKTAQTLASENERLVITKAAREKAAIEADQARVEELEKLKAAYQKEADEETNKYQGMAQRKADSQNRLLQLENELDAKVAALNRDEFAKKKAVLDAEVKARLDAANREIKINTDKAKAIDKIHAYEKAATLALEKEKMIYKQEAAFQVADLAVQTLQTVNALGEKGSSAERARAKALLVLQQSIAIGWAWVNAMKIGGPAAPAIAAAQTALIVAQTAQGMRAIDSAANREQADISGININAPVPGIDLGGTSPSTGGGSGTLVTVGGSGGSGGSSVGGGAVINVGGVIINFDVDKLSTDNIREVMDRITEAVRRGTIEGVQLAVTLQNSANRNNSLAV